MYLLSPQDQPFSVSMCVRGGNLQAESGLCSWPLWVLSGTTFVVLQVLILMLVLVFVLGISICKNLSESLIFVLVFAFS